MYELIMEQLVNGTPPSAISDNILSFVSTFLPNTIVKELPSIWTVRRTRTILLIVVEALAAYQLAIALCWKQLFTDGTSRRQTFMQNLAISIEDTTETDDGLLKLKPILLSTTTYTEGEESDQVVAGLIQTLVEKGTLLDGWKSKHKELFGDDDNDIPDSTNLNLSKLGDGGAIMTDTCNAANKINRKLAE